MWSPLKNSFSWIPHGAQVHGLHHRIGSTWRRSGEPVCAQVVGSPLHPLVPSEHMSFQTRWLNPIFWRRAQLWAFSCQCHSSWQMGTSEQATYNVPYSPCPRMFTRRKSLHILWLQINTVVFTSPILWLWKDTWLSGTWSFQSLFFSATRLTFAANARVHYQEDQMKALFNPGCSFCTNTFCLAT